MKLLRSPIAVGVLVVVALGLIVKSLWPVLSGGSRRPSPPSVAAKPAAVLPAAAKTTAAKPAAADAKKRAGETPASPSAAPAPEVDWTRVQTNAARWVESPRRDPFQVRDWPGHLTGTNPPASAFLTLNGIWRQTGSTLAVINNSVVGEGDTILQFKIQSIEPDRVWVFGPSGAEVLPFKSIVFEDAEIEPGETGKKPPAPKHNPAPRVR